MKIVINPNYNQLKSFILNISNTFQTEGEIIYNERNVLKVYAIEGLEVVVKRFKKPHIINQIAYSFFRPSKAERSYEYALKLLEKGISTPTPIAYIEEKRNGLLKYSYYICISESQQSHIRKQMLGETNEEFLKALARFIAELHNKVVLDKDLSPGNVLFNEENGVIHFSLIDINRMRFLEKIPLKTRYENFKRISENAEVIKKLAKEYARVCGINEQETILAINKYVSRFSGNNYSF